MLKSPFSTTIVPNVPPRIVVLGALPYVTGSLSDALNINSVGVRITVSNCANMPIVDPGVYYVISTFSNTANEYFTIAYKLSGSEIGGSWFAFIKNTMSSINWTRLDVPNFYKNYNDLAALSQGLANGYVQIPTNSFASLQGKNYPSFRWLNDNSSTPFGEDKTTIMGKCVTSLNDPNYTMIDIWHVASPQTIYHGMMQNNVVGTWYKMDMTVV